MGWPSCSRSSGSGSGGWGWSMAVLLPGRAATGRPARDGRCPAGVGGRGPGVLVGPAGRRDAAARTARRAAQGRRGPHASPAVVLAGRGRAGGPGPRQAVLLAGSANVALTVVTC